MEPIRYYQGLRDVTAHWNFGSSAYADAPRPFPTRILERAVFTPDIGVCLCEATRSLWIEVLDYSPDWGGADVPDDVREWWQESLCCESAEGFYVHRSAVCSGGYGDDPPEFGAFFEAVMYQGDYTPDDPDSEADFDGLEAAREDACANHLV